MLTPHCLHSSGNLDCEPNKSTSILEQMKMISCGEDGTIRYLSIQHQQDVSVDATNARLVYGETLRQDNGSRYPFKCFDIVQKHYGKGYLLFAAGAKEYLQVFEMTPSDEKGGESISWRALCFIGGDKVIKKKPLSNCEKEESKIDPKKKKKKITGTKGKWLIITGNSIGTIRVHSLDEKNAKQLELEGEDPSLHKESNHFVPVLSLTSTFSSYHQCHPSQQNATQMKQTKDEYHHFDDKTEIRCDETNDNLHTSNPSHSCHENNEDVPPDLMFSGTTNGCIYAWIWNMRSRSTQLVNKFKLHQSGVNSISFAWLNPTFIPLLSCPSQTTSNVSGKLPLKRRFVVTSGGDDQSVGLLIADLELEVAPKIKSESNRNSIKSSANDEFNSTVGLITNHLCWRISVVKRLTIASAHLSSVRAVCVLPIALLYRPTSHRVFTRDNDAKSSESTTGENQFDSKTSLSLISPLMEKVLVITTGEDQRVRIWSYHVTETAPTNENDGIELLEQSCVEIGLITSLSAQYIPNHGVLIGIAGQGLQLMMLPTDEKFWNSFYITQIAFVAASVQVHEKNCIFIIPALQTLLYYAEIGFFFFCKDEFCIIF
ncbi:hypothetical protein RFI_35123 [Reticulomyxa filosa]|uniref:Uncharacterized protein n=1 Tax=Reticulomyxa filosa TaxID=46433 RepID=X6LMD8_RETFI|nr:hypothetical protein RFI_35123 [Reticulomyxa filosa]|eukprot:ETO02312.1 hypothetical protein RFI_35123 [Reticulomyxa filosa]